MQKEEIKEHLEVNEGQELSQESTQEGNQNLDGNVENQSIILDDKTKKDLHQNLVDKLTQSKLTAQMKYEEYVKVDKELEKATIDFMELENHIVKTTVADSIALLKDIGVENLEESIKEAKEIVQENKVDMLHIKPLSKGGFSAFIFGVLGTLLTASGLTLFGAKLAALPLTPPTFMQKSNLDAIANKLAALINIKDTPIAGYLLVAAISLLVGLIVFNLAKFIKKRKNIKYVQRLESDVEKYVEELNEKIKKSKELTEHLEHIKQVMQKYDIILQEQNAKIRRMLFIEQPENGLESLQRASRVEVEKTVLILDELLKLMNTTVNDGLEITQESHENLHSANSIINEVIKKLYI